VIGPPKWIGEAASHDELVTILRERQLALGLSNELVGHVARLSDGHVDKLLGPARQRGLSQLSLDALLGVLAVKIIIVEDEAMAARIKPHWQGKDNRQVRLPVRIAKDLIARVRPAVLRQLASKAATARWSRTTPEARRAVMQAVSAARRHARGAVVHAPSGRCGTSGPSPGGAS
jgi:hypothetical protein